jgi:hypothetical protein
MRTILSWMSIVFFVVGAGILAYAGYLYATQQTGPVVHVANAEQELTLEANKNRTVTFEVVNTGRKPVRAVGLTGNCGLGGCLVPKQQPPFDLPPGKTHIECELRVGPPGPIDATAFLYLNDFGLQTHLLRVRGQIVATPGQAEPNTPADAAPSDGQ